MKTVGTLVVAALCATAYSQSFFDDFNRPDGPLGTDYTTFHGSVEIIGNEAGSIADGSGVTLVNSGVFAGAYNQTMVQGDVRVIDQSTTLTYIALILGGDGLLGVDHGIYVKVQRQGSGMFDFIGIYTGDNMNSGSISTPGGNFQALSTPFSAGRLTIKTLDALTLYTGIDTDFDNIDDMVYNSTLSIPPLELGNQVGLHVFGTTGRLDNFRAVVPEPASIAALALGAAVLLRRRLR